MNLDLQISEIYYNLVEAFNSPEINRLFSYYKDNLEINLESDTKSSFRLVYKFSENKYEFLYKYLNSSLVSRFI